MVKQIMTNLHLKKKKKALSHTEKSGLYLKSICNLLALNQDLQLEKTLISWLLISKYNSLSLCPNQGLTKIYC